MHSVSYSLSFRGKLYNLHSPTGANLQPIHSPDMSHLEPAPPLSWIRNSRPRKTLIDSREVQHSPSFSKVFPRLSSPCPHPNCLSGNSFIVWRATIDHLENQYIQSHLKPSFLEIGGKGRARIHSRVLRQWHLHCFWYILQDQVYMFYLIVHAPRSVSFSPLWFL